MIVGWFVVSPPTAAVVADGIGAGIAAVAAERQDVGAIEPIATPAGTNSAQPHLSTSLRGVLLSWIERDGPKATLRFSERTAAGWSAPRDVASGTNWFVNWADVPSVVRLARQRAGRALAAEERPRHLCVRRAARLFAG